MKLTGATKDDQHNLLPVISILRHRGMSGPRALTSLLSPTGGSIALSTNHRLETRARIIVSARKLFNQFGFDGVSIQQIMSNAGLTHGGFYKHSRGKPICTRRCWSVSSPTQNGTTTGRASIST